MFLVPCLALLTGCQGWFQSTFICPCPAQGEPSLSHRLPVPSSVSLAVFISTEYVLMNKINSKAFLSIVRVQHGFWDPWLETSQLGPIPPHGEGPPAKVSPHSRVKTNERKDLVLQAHPLLPRTGRKVTRLRHISCIYALLPGVGLLGQQLGGPWGDCPSACSTPSCPAVPRSPLSWECFLIIW